MTRIYKVTRTAVTEYASSTDIDVNRRHDGEITIRLGSWTERIDKSIRMFKLSAEEAMNLGMALCGTEEDMEGILERASAHCLPDTSVNYEIKIDTSVDGFKSGMRELNIQIAHLNSQIGEIEMHRDRLVKMYDTAVRDYINPASLSRLSKTWIPRRLAKE